jgi:hypothetical protein
MRLFPTNHPYMTAEWQEDVLGMGDTKRGAEARSTVLREFAQKLMSTRCKREVASQPGAEAPLCIW